MIKIQFRFIQRQPYEIQMGHCTWGYEVPEADCVSATAKKLGFTPLNSVSNAYCWNKNEVGMASALCVDMGEIQVVASLKPKLILIPPTRGLANRELSDSFIQTLIKERIRWLHMSHFGFIQNRFPTEEFKTLLRNFSELEGKTELHTVTVDVDERARDVARNIFLEYLNNHKLDELASPRWIAA